MASQPKELSFSPTLLFIFILNRNFAAMMQLLPSNFFQSNTGIINLHQTMMWLLQNNSSDEVVHASVKMQMN
jgi:hypothetical protein